MPRGERTKAQEQTLLCFLLFILIFLIKGSTLEMQCIFFKEENEMRKIVILFATVIMMLLFAVSASAATEGYYTYAVSNGEAKITEVSTSISGDVTIPDTLDGYKVTSIGSYAFYNCTGLTSVIIPNTVTQIEGFAFRGCSGLTSIILPFVGSSRTASDRYNAVFGYIFGYTSSRDWDTVCQFYDPNECYYYYVPSSLKSVTITDDDTIPQGAFYGCSELVNIIIPDTVTSIGGGAFSRSGYYYDENNWEDDVLYIGDYLVGSSSTITFCNVRKGTKLIADSVFQFCDDLENVTIPDSVTSIGDYAFAESHLTSITLPNSITEIGNRVFLLTNLTSITIPDSVTTIGARAFGECSRLASVTIPNSVTTIGDYAFANCDSLTSIAIPVSVTYIGKDAFENHGSIVMGRLKYVFYEGTEAQKKKIVFDSGNEGLKFDTVWHYQAIGHTWDAGKITTDSTCAKDGIKTYNCTENGCDATESEVIAKKTNHTWDAGKITTDSTCVKEGVKTYTCTASGCGKTYTEAVAKKTNHTWDAGKITKDSTCAKAGVKTYTCTLSGCGATRTEAVAKKTTHTYNNNCDKTCNVCKAPRSIKHDYKTSTTKATLKKNGKQTRKCTVCGDVSKTTTVYYPKTIKLEYTSTTFNGKAQKPKVTVKDSKGKAVSNDNYTVKYAKDCKNPGKYTVTVTFKGKYEGTKKLTFTIKPKKATISKVTAGSKQLTATWKTVTGASGYEVMYSTSSKFSSKTTKTATVKKGSSKKTTIKKLAKGKTYYVKVRAYKTVDGKKVYGAWSSVKSVKVK